MSHAKLGIIDLITDLLEQETAFLKAGDVLMVEGTAKRKARLLHQLSQSEEWPDSSSNTVTSLQRMHEALQRNLQSCNENAEALRELVSIHLRMEQELDSDGTYHSRAGYPNRR
ncbi:MAG: hypothetical protein WCC66_15390 [Rhizobiaceae bacterium]